MGQRVQCDPLDVRAEAKSTEMSSSGDVTLTRQSAPNAPSSRNILASSSKLKTGSASSPVARLVVSTSIRLASSSTINQNSLGTSAFIGGLLSSIRFSAGRTCDSSAPADCCGNGVVSH
jgi:hypothetical protein